MSDAGYVYTIDTERKGQGRGAHVCPECVDKCIKTRALNRSFKTNLPQKVYEDLSSRDKTPCKI